MPHLPHDPLAQAIASVARTVRLWKFGGLSPWQVIVRTVRGYQQNHFGARAAQFAYYSLLALFPLLILIIAALARIPLQDVLKSSLDAADRGLPEDVYQLIQHQVKDIQEHSTVGLISLSLMVVASAGSGVFLTITDGLNAAYGIPESRRFWHVYGMAFLLTIAASLLMLVAMVMMVVGPILSDWMATHRMDFPWLRLILSRGVRWGVVCGFLWLYTAAVYSLVPSVKLPFYWLSPGSVFAVIGWVLVSQGFRLYVENMGRYNEAYGALGGVIVLIIWLDLTGTVLLLGGQINSVIHRAAAVTSSPPPEGLPS